jgi:hypothetical protein
MPGAIFIGHVSWRSYDNSLYPERLGLHVLTLCHEGLSNFMSFVGRFWAYDRLLHQRVE